jgi:hypothetical protein
MDAQIQARFEWKILSLGIVSPKRDCSETAVDFAEGALPGVGVDC